jgi:hypothetical protein
MEGDLPRTPPKDCTVQAAEITVLVLAKLKEVNYRIVKDRFGPV